MPEKLAIRQKMRHRIRALSERHKAHAAEHVCLLLKKQLTQSGASHVATYAATRSELSLLQLHALLPEISFYYPLCLEEGKMTFHHVSDPSTLQRGAFNILEPKPEIHQHIDPAILDTILVPALAYDMQGNRLGKGRGFYDRYLPQLQARCQKLGILFREQLIPQVPTSPHDIGVNQLFFA